MTRSLDEGERRVWWAGGGRREKGKEAWMASCAQCASRLRNTDYRETLTDRQISPWSIPLLLKQVSDMS